MSYVSGNSTAGVLLTSYDEKIGSRFHVKNGEFYSFEQKHKLFASSFIWCSQNIDIFIKKYYNIFLLNIFFFYFFYKYISYYIYKLKNYYFLYK